jgi:hypothetical protein
MANRQISPLKDGDNGSPGIPRGGFLAAKDAKIVLFFVIFSPIVLPSETKTSPKEVILLQAGALGIIWPYGM